MSPSNRNARAAWLLLGALALLSLTLVLAPAVLIYPFRPQTHLAVALSYEMRRVAPVVTLATLLPVGWFAGRIVGGMRRRWLLAPLVALVALPVAAAWFARQNHFEWMFAPLPDPAYAKAAEASFVDDPDMMIAVQIGDDAVAYPVRQMAYHHLVNDVVGKEPVVSTY